MSIVLKGILKYVVLVFCLISNNIYAITIPETRLLDSTILVKRESFNFQFLRNDATVDRGLSDNDVTFRNLYEFLQELQKNNLKKIQKIEINGYMSFDEVRHHNIVQRRIESVLNIIESFNILDSRFIKNKDGGINWDKFLNLSKTADLPYKNNVVNILNYSSRGNDISGSSTRLSLINDIITRIKAIDGGFTYSYMFDNIFPHLRFATVDVIYEDRDHSEIHKPSNVNENVADKEGITKEINKQVENELLFVKTNLLFLAVAAINLELEVPMSKKISIYGEIIAPWWESSPDADSKRHTYKIFAWNAGIKYWFRNSVANKHMMGWFTGLYGGMGSYTLGMNKKGNVGDFMNMGVDVGYAHKIGKKERFRMEYTLGLGCIKADYERYTEDYDSMYWKKVYDDTGDVMVYGPTKVKVSLVWILRKDK